MFYNHIFEPTRYVKNLALLSVALLLSVTLSTAAQVLSDSNPSHSRLPACPPLVAGLPEPTTATGEDWVPGLNCTLQPAPRELFDDTATSEPLNTLDPSFRTHTSQTTQSAYPGENQQTARVGVGATNNYQAIQQLEQTLEQVRGRVGLSYLTRPHYLGADTNSPNLSLLLDLTFGSGGSLTNEDGLGWRIVSLGDIESKVSLNWHGEQTFKGRTGGLSAMGNQGYAEADLVFSDFGVSYELEFSRGIKNSNGWTLTAAVSSEIPMDTGILTTRLGATHASENWMRSYYGISASEAEIANLSAYRPGGGLRDLFAEANVEVPFNENMGLDISLGLRQLMGPAKNAPQVADVGSTLNYRVGTAFYYRFLERFRKATQLSTKPK